MLFAVFTFIKDRHPELFLKIGDGYGTLIDLLLGLSPAPPQRRHARRRLFALALGSALLLPLLLLRAWPSLRAAAAATSLRAWRAASAAHGAVSGQ